MNFSTLFYINKLKNKKREREKYVIKIKEINEWMNKNYISPKTKSPLPLILFNSKGDIISEIKENLYGGSIQSSNLSNKKIKTSSSKKLDSIFNRDFYNTILLDYADDPLKLNDNINMLKKIKQGKNIYIIKHINDVFLLLENLLLIQMDNNKKLVKEHIFLMIDQWFNNKNRFHNPIIFWISKENKYTYYLRKYAKFVRYDYENYSNDNIYKMTEYFLLGTVNGKKKNINIEQEDNIPLNHIYNNLEFETWEDSCNLLDNISEMDSIMGNIDSSSYGDGIIMRNNFNPYYYDLLFKNARQDKRLTSLHWSKLKFGNKNNDNIRPEKFIFSKKMNKL